MTLSLDATRDYLAARHARDRRRDLEQRARLLGRTIPERPVGECERWPLLFVSDDQREQQTAKALCARCPLFEQCDARARELRPIDGVWAGRVWRPKVPGSTEGAPR